MSEIIINPNTESRHFILAQSHIFDNKTYTNNSFQEYSGINTPQTPSASYFPNGYCINSKFTNGWYNVNFKQILGDLYDKYDKFYLCLNSIFTQTSTAGFVESDSYMKTFYIKVNGLPFENIQNYKSCIFSIVKTNYLPNSTKITNPSLQFFKFSKVPLSNIEIQLFYLRDDKQVSGSIHWFGSTLILNQAYGFSIYPCEN